jgi:tetratricopeptide (TPR) repeat protein
MKLGMHMFWCACVALAGLCHSEALAQSSARAAIDQERPDVSFLEDKALEKSRSWIRQDSTYYVGHLYLGGYLFFRANDKLGFTKAITPLLKAMDLMEEEFGKQLRVRSNSYATYSAVYRYQSDYGLISYLLDRCYQNVEMPDKAMEVLEAVRDKNMQLESTVTPYNTMAWIFHRNRVYTSQQFPFLKNSVKENVKAANQYLDSAIMKLQRDMPMNAGLFDPNFLNRQYLGTFHYKAMIYDYKLAIDTAEYYYNLLIQNNAYSSNNYAEFKLAMGEFNRADLFFKEAEEREASPEKTTKEYYYMRGTLETYRGHPEEADTLLRKVLESQGATPGYGWHCIGLSRALHFEGLTEQSQERANKAARFQEMHIGTTWGQEQYNLAIASLNYINQAQFEKEYMFEHDEWWFWLNPVNWYKWIAYSLEIRHHKLVLASLVAENPEREQVIYTIFSPENLISFDEVYSVIDGFGNEYFIDVYKRLLATDKRPRVKKYFRYFLGKLYLAEGNDSEAKKYFQQVLDDPEVDDEYQKMLYARVYEGLAKASSGDEGVKWTQNFYRTFPSLVPFSGLTMRFRLDAQAESDAQKDILDGLKDCSIDFVSDSNAPLVTVSFSESNDAVNVRYSVLTGNSDIITNGAFRVPKSEIDGGGKLLAYRLFKINKEKIGEKPEVAEAPKDKKAV